MRGPRVVRDEKVCDAQQGDGLAEFGLAGQNERPCTHPPRDLFAHARLFARADERDFDAEAFDERVGERGESLGGPAFRAAVGRAGAEHDERATGARATLALSPVEDPTAYGLVRYDRERAITEFVEKPAYDQIDTNFINAGAYVLEREVLAAVPADQNVSIEREVFPRLIGGGLYAFPTEGYWLDIGTPHRYLRGTFDIIEGNCRTEVGERLGDTFLSVADDVRADGRIVPPAVVGRGASVEQDAHVGALVVLGPGVSVGARSSIERAVVMQGAQIGEDCVLSDCIVAAGARIGDRTHITGGAVLGEGVTIGPDNLLTRGVRIFPHVEIPESGVRF